MAIPAGYTLAPNGFFYYTDGSGPYTVSQGGVATLIGSGAASSIISNTSGTYAARPVATSVNAGSLYYATDTMEVYSSNGTIWTARPSGGTEVGYVRLASPIQTTNTTATQVTGASITVKAGERPLVISAGGLASNVTSGGRCRVEIRQGTGTIIAIMNGGYFDPNLTFPSVSAEVSLRSLTPGTDYTFNLFLQCAGGIGTANMYSDAETGWFLKACTS